MQIIDYILASIGQAFITIPNEGILSTVYLIANFILLLLAGLASGGGILNFL